MFLKLGNYTKKIALLGALTFPQILPAVSGQYVGVLEHETLQKEQLAKLDLISSKDANNNLKIQGILTLHFGDFRSSEYVTYHYDKVVFDAINSTLTFDQENQEITITTVKFNSTTFVGNVRSNTNGFVGKLTLNKSLTAAPTLPLIEPLWGEYKGNCHGIDQYLQVQTFRSKDDTHRAGNPFASYQISAQIADPDEVICGNSGSEFDPTPRCVKGIYNSGSYDFFRDELLLSGSTGRTLSCSVQQNGITCDQCKMTRISKETAAPRALSWPKNVDAFPLARIPAGNIGPISGEYYGYVFHEYLNQYQAAKVSIVSFQDPSAPSGSLRISAVANLFFGDFKSSEVLTYRFDERNFPILSQEFVLSQPEADVDALLKVVSFAKDTIKGVWYSQLFGRVGEFILVKDQAPSLDPSASLMPALKGQYMSPLLELNIATKLGQTPVNTDNPFYPLMFGGYFYYHAGITPRIPVLEGTYDFYTGRIGFIVDDGERFAMGMRKTGTNDLELKWLAKKYGALLQNHKAVSFKFKK